MRKVVLCLDHDRPGQEAAERMGRKYAAEGYVVQTLSPPSRKDWNAYWALYKSRSRSVVMTFSFSATTFCVFPDMER